MDMSLFTVRPSTDFSLTLKAYWEANGLSAAIFNGGTEASYMFKGPMGKGLSVQDHGNHVAFAAGTGVITFMDLAGFVARKIMG